MFESCINQIIQDSEEAEKQLEKKFSWKLKEVSAKESSRNQPEHSSVISY